MVFYMICFIDNDSNKEKNFAKNSKIIYNISWIDFGPNSTVVVKGPLLKGLVQTHPLSFHRDWQTVLGSRTMSNPVFSKL